MTTNLRDIIRVEIAGPSYLDYHIIPVPKDKRSFFPGYKVDFSLNTNVGEHTAHVTSARFDSDVGNGSDGGYICGRLRRWFEHNSIDVGSVLEIEQVCRHREYRVRVL